MELSALCESTNGAGVQEHALRQLPSRLPGLENGDDWFSFISNGFAKQDATSVRHAGVLLNDALFDWLANETSSTTYLTIDLAKSRLWRLLLDGDPKTPGQKIGDLQRLLGVSLGELAILVGVDRRSLYSWSARSTVRNKNLDRLTKLWSTIQFIDRGSAEQNRALLTTIMPDGGSVRELLVAGHFDLVRNLVGKGVSRAASGTPMDQAWLHAHGRKSMDVLDLKIPDKIVPIKRAPAKGKVRRTIPRA